MKPTIKHLPLLSAGLGLAALLARLGLFAFGTDHKGLLICGHPLDLLTWLLTAVMAAVTLAVLRRQDAALSADAFRPCAAAAAGCLAMAAGTLLSVLSSLMAWARLDVIRNWLGFAAAASLLLLALLRLRGKQPFFLFHALVCLFLTVRTVSHYQTWCARPLLQNYVFPMAASIAMALFAYHQTAADVNMGSRRMLTATGLAGAFLCLAAAAGGEDAALYLGGAAWMLTGLQALTPGDHAHEAA